MSVGIVRSDIFLAHETDPYHPENPERLRRIYAMLDNMGSEGITDVSPRMATHEEIGLVHDMRYVEAIASTKGKQVRLDPDTTASPRSYEAACMAVGGTLRLADMLLNNEVDSAFGLVRPPGHHAERNRAMGFCIFNNIAIAAEYLKTRYGLQRIMIVDFDLHHGNGTQHIFYMDPMVLYLSTHQYPYYPGTGGIDEIGDGEGKGYTINVPLPYGMGDGDYVYIFKEVFVPVADQFKPEAILCSAGFDTHRNDPLGGMAVTEKGFAMMTRIILNTAKRHCEGRALFGLEGGYDLNALTSSVKAVIMEMKGVPYSDQNEEEEGYSDRTVDIVERVKKIHRGNWQF